MDTDKFERLRRDMSKPERVEGAVRELIAEARTESNEREQYRLLLMIQIGEEECIVDDDDYFWRQARMKELTPRVVAELLDEARDGNHDSLRWVATLTDWTRRDRHSFYRIFTDTHFVPPSDWNELMSRPLAARPKASTSTRTRSKTPARL